MSIEEAEGASTGEEQYRACTMRVEPQFSGAAAYIAGELFDRAAKTIVKGFEACPPAPAPPPCECPTLSKLVVGAVVGGSVVQAGHVVYQYLFGPRHSKVQRKGVQAMDTYEGGRFKFLGRRANEYFVQEAVTEKEDKSYRLYKCCRRLRLVD